MMSRWKRSIAVTLAFAMVVLSTGRAQAALAPASSQSTRVQDIQKVQTFLEQKEISDHLTKMGMSTEEAQQRLGNLSDQEVHEVATRIDQENPGRDGAGLVITVLVIGVLALLFVYLLKRV